MLIVIESRGVSLEAGGAGIGNRSGRDYPASTLSFCAKIRSWEGCPPHSLLILHGELEVRPEETVTALSQCLLVGIFDDRTIN